MRFRSIIAPLAICAALPILMGAEGDGCSQQHKDQLAVREKTLNAETFIPKNDLDRKNYNNRQKRADDPTTIMWCTSSFPIPSSPLFTVPIVGKLTSGDKKPLPTDANTAGPDGMYGSSNPYEYGFSPTTNLAEFRNMPVFCTDAPTVWQRQETKIAMAIDPALLAAHNAAKEALAASKPEEANRILAAAIAQIK